MVVLSVVDIVLLIAGLAFYLFVVGTPADPHRRRTSRSATRSPVRSSPTPQPIIPGVEHINRTGGVVAGALPLLYGMAEGIVDRRHPHRPSSRPSAARLGRPPGGAARACTTASATSPQRRYAGRGPRAPGSVEPDPTVARTSARRRLLGGPPGRGRSSTGRRSGRSTRRSTRRCQAWSYCCSLQLGW